MSKKKLTSESYNDSSVNVLEALDGIRMRYNMYVGSTPIFHCLKEVLDNSIDEVMNGYADTVTIYVDTVKNRFKIQDNGRGMPNGENPKLKKNNIEILHTMLHSGAKFDGNKEFKKSGGMNGVGLKALCALTKYLKVTSERDDNTRRYVEFSKGKATTSAIDEKPTGKTGTTTEFIPDMELLGDKAKIDIEDIKETCKLRAYLNKGSRIILYIDKEKPIEFYSENGISDYIETLIDKPLYGIKPISRTININDSEYDISFSFKNDTEEIIQGFCNGIVLSRGTHETGFKSAITRFFNNYIKDNNLLSKRDSNLTIKGEDIRRGLVCVINMKVMEPEYTGQTKDELSNNEVIGHISQVFNDIMSVWAVENEDKMKKLANRVIQFAKASEAVKKAQEKIVKITTGGTLTLSSKFTDCKEKDPNKAELLIVEGK